MVHRGLRRRHHPQLVGADVGCGGLEEIRAVGIVIVIEGRYLSIVMCWSGCCSSRLRR